MHDVIGQCPICREELHVTRLSCDACGTNIEGNFALGKFHNLSPEQLNFIVAFLRCGGVIKKVEDMLGMSYPAVRARLDNIIQALGLAVDREPAVSTERRREILAQLSEGTISTEEAVELLKGQE